MMTQPHLVYFADPMCSWCWGFAPVINAIRGRYGERLPVRLIVGGLRPGTTEPMDEAAKARTRGHWELVRNASGQPFDFSFFDRARFVYDTEPACRALVVARRRSMADAFDLLAAIQRAFYTGNEDVTNPVVLAGIAARLGFNANQFRDTLCSDELGAETWQDFAITQQAGITGFPTLIASSGTEHEYALVTEGFQPAARLVPALGRWLGDTSLSGAAALAG
ncbi:DsbA family protein [Acidiphilium sp.]|uniref:DsbA family protein n=1 Tax=Acidiphilium sp. TaxID=527 RepID=UPI00258C4B56|nr:DsbA family protein [Acidiphilium sp.]